MVRMYSSSQSSIIVDAEVLQESHIPEKLKGMESQIEQILCCLSPITQKHKPIHLWLHGQTGTGKTTTAIHSLRCLEEKARVKSLIINCFAKRTFYEILDEMVSGFRILRAEEHRTSFKLEKLRSHLEGRPFVVILDEIDQIKSSELSMILYNLDTILNAGLVCISNSTQALLGLEERVRSRLNPHTIFFPPFSSRSLLEILTHRAELALSPGSWTNKLLNRIAGTAKGDARTAIRMLHRSAVLADHQHMDKVSTKSLEQQIRKARETRRESILRNLTEDHRILYEIVKRKGSILSGDLWEGYLQRCSQIRRKPLAPRTFSEHTNRIVQAGLVTCERARVRGKVRLFKACC